MESHYKSLKWAETILDDFTTHVTAITAGLGAGKTHAAFQWHLLRCVVNENSAYSAVMYPTFAESRQIGQDRYNDTLKEAGYKEGKHYEIFTSQIDPRIEISALNHTVRFLSADNPKRLRAAEYSHALSDEVGDMELEAYSNLRSRIRCKDAYFLQSMWVGVPQGLTWFSDEFDSDTQDGWIKDTEQDHRIERYVEEFDTYRRFRRLRVRTDDNPELPAGYVAELVDDYGHNPNLLRAYREGIFCPLFVGTAYSFNESQHCESLEPDVHRPISMCWDFNIELVWTAVQLQPFHEGITRELKYAAIAECDKDCDSFDDAIFSFCKQFPPSKWKNTPIEIYGDRSGHARSHKAPVTDYQWILKDLRKFYSNVTLRAAEQVAPEIASVESVNKVFKRRRLVVDPGCKELIRGFQRTQWKKGKKVLDKPMGEDWTHRPDGLKYFIYQKEVIDALSGRKRIRGINI